MNRNQTMIRPLIFAGILWTLLLGCPPGQAQTSDVSSTSIAVVARADSACVTIDGVVVDGSNGTPKAAPYNGGQWFSNVAAASSYVGRTLTKAAATACVTTCQANATFNGATCTCSAGFVASGTSCVAAVTCTPSSVNNAPVACSSVFGPGYTGTTYTTTSVSCSSGTPSTASPPTTSGYNTTGCTPPVLCNSTPVVQAATCQAISAALGWAHAGSGYWSGTGTQTTTQHCSSIYQPPTSQTVTYSGPSCVDRTPVLCSTAPTTQYYSCNTIASSWGWQHQGAWSGTASSTTTNVCNGSDGIYSNPSSSSTSWNTASCVDTTPATCVAGTTSAGVSPNNLPGWVVLSPGGHGQTSFRRKVTTCSGPYAAPVDTYQCLSTAYYRPRGSVGSNYYPCY